jgi:trehalose-6-phosphate synthase
MTTDLGPRHHLIPIADALRRRGHSTGSVFLHVPFPPPEVPTSLPNHEQLIPLPAHMTLWGFRLKAMQAISFAI